MSNILNSIDLCYTSCLKDMNVSYSGGTTCSKDLHVKNIVTLVSAAYKWGR